MPASRWTGLTVAEHFRDQARTYSSSSTTSSASTQAGSDVGAPRLYPVGGGLSADLATEMAPPGAHHHHLNTGSIITSVQAIYVPADDLIGLRRRPPSSPTPDATTVLSRSIAEKGIYPAVDPLDSTSRILSPLVIEEHYAVARQVQQILQRCCAPGHIAILHGRALEEDKIVAARARKIERFLSQPFHVAEVFTGRPRW